MDRIYARTHARRLCTEADRAVRRIVDFAADGPCYAGTSWGKDATVISHLVSRALVERGVRIPLVHVHVDPHANPDCALVRDDFLSRFEVDYYQITVTCERDEHGEWIGTGRLEQGFQEAAKRFGARYVSGVRGQESGGRARRMRGHGTTTDNTCAPIGWWTVRDVFAYLLLHDLPIHPAYACTHGGRFDRDHLRVATLGGIRGTEFGRREHELRYYRAELQAIGLDRSV